MRLLRHFIGVILLQFVLLATASAEVRAVNPSQNLQSEIDAAYAGDQLVLSAGRYVGNFIITKSIILSGESGAIIDANGQDHALVVDVPDARIETLEIRNWGGNLTTLDAGIFVNKQAANTQIIGNYLVGDTFGIWVDGTQHVQIKANRIEGNLNVRSQDRGNGIHLFNVGKARVEGNEVWHTRDGIYIDTSNHNELIGNYLHDLRYGVHYMYSYHNRVSGNHTLNTRTGYALMQSKFLTVTDNISENDSNYGILMNFITKSTIENNWVSGVQNNRPNAGEMSIPSQTEGKGLFIYNSLFNRIRGNHFSDNDLGVHMTAGSEDNIFTGNAFVNNREQVKYVSTRHQNWSHEGVGNYWSDYLGWDMDGDGIGDTQYEPTDGVDRLLWKFPAARVLLNSPAVETIRWVQRQFPVLKAQGVVDTHPLMNMPEHLSVPAASDTIVMEKTDDKHS
ncbi:nitrous oxide reductase family maturation protein NosD [Neptunomonas antarctica]|uniref:Nitrous oxidase accessory protein n=1 Tax=Neptunomonas antarctica TaxID=619304 RepID=A0A1N7J039_9GAMM|nr:nitrous oxide reductase family maturation protein NosD [Neptunomonas antarctica]SIS42723.1 nitrous oxidase accessory protein [Neptunomonas antarctica]